MNPEFILIFLVLTGLARLIGSSQPSPILQHIQPSETPENYKSYLGVLLCSLKMDTSRDDQAGVATRDLPAPSDVHTSQHTAMTAPPGLTTDSVARDDNRSLSGTPSSYRPDSVPISPSRDTETVIPGGPTARNLHSSLQDSYAHAPRTPFGGPPTYGQRLPSPQSFGPQHYQNGYYGDGSRFNAPFQPFYGYQGFPPHQQGQVGYHGGHLGFSSMDNVVGGPRSRDPAHAQNGTTPTSGPQNGGQGDTLPWNSQQLAALKEVLGIDTLQSSVKSISESLGKLASAQQAPKPGNKVVQVGDNMSARRPSFSQTRDQPTTDTADSTVLSLVR